MDTLGSSLPDGGKLPIATSDAAAANRKREWTQAGRIEGL